MLAQAATLALVASRISGFVAVSPFPGDRIPATARVALIVVLSFLTASLVPATAMRMELGLPLIGAAVVEFLAGLLIGAAFRFLMAAADVVGGVSAQTSSLGAASLYDPSTGSSDSALSQMMTLLAVCVALAIGAHRVAFAYLIESFRVLPIGAVPWGIPFGAAVLVDMSGQCLVIGVRLAMPAIAVSLTVQAALAMVARAAPSLQIFSVGFAVMIVAGLATILASLPAIGTGLAEEMGQLGMLLDRIFEAMGSR